jgi:hypothetical protein
MHLSPIGHDALFALPTTIVVPTHVHDVTPEHKQPHRRLGKNAMATWPGSHS